MRHEYRTCEDQDDAAGMAETILRELGYDPQRGPNSRPVNEAMSVTMMLNVARNAERIARWARAEAKRVR